MREAVPTLIFTLTCSDVSQVFSFFIGFLFQSIQVTFGTFGLGVAAILVVCGLIISYGVLNEKFACACKTVCCPALVDVQQAPRHLAFAEGDEGKAAMTANGDRCAKREGIRLLVEGGPPCGMLFGELIVSSITVPCYGTRQLLVSRCVAQLR